MSMADRGRRVPRGLARRLFGLACAWTVAALSLLVAAAVLPGIRVQGFTSALVAAALIAALNAVVPPLVAALRVPYTLLINFVLILVADGLMIEAVSRIAPDSLAVDSFGWALLAALVMAAVSVMLEVVLGTNDDDAYMLRVARRIARRSGDRVESDVPGLLFLEIDGLALPVLRRAVRDGTVPTMAAWIAAGSHRLVEWETDLSSQTGAAQAGILLGSNHDIPAFRWVEKETGRVMTCSSPADCAEIERRLATGRGLLVGGGASRGNLLSGEADHVILTVSRMDSEKGANPGYRAFFANGSNVTRTLVLFGWEVILELMAAARAVRRDVRPRGHRGGTYPFVRAALCVVVRDLIVFGVVLDMMRGRPAVYATFSSYDEVAHHSGLERVDTLEALRKLDQQFARIDRARPHAARPYDIVVLSDHGQTQGATFRQRNGYGLDDLVERALSGGRVAAMGGGDENDTAVGRAVAEATGHDAPGARPATTDAPETARVAVLASGNLGLVYLMAEPRRLTLEEIDAAHPDLIPTLRAHPHVGWVLVRSAADGALLLGPRGVRHLASGRVEGDDPLAVFSPTAATHLLRADGFPHAADITVGSFYEPQAEEGCAFEELISFHGGLGGPQTRPFLLYPAHLPAPPDPLLGAAAVHEVLAGWRDADAAGDGPA